MNQRYINLWSSITVYCNEKVTQFRAAYPGIEVSYIDWESSNVQELPAGDLIGPASLTISEYDSGLLTVTLAVGVSTHTADTNLFRQRTMVSTIFEDLAAEKTLPYYDANLALQSSVLKMTAGTMIAPMTKSDVRPWQYVQAEGLLVPA